jgi:hypothetical protein
MITIFDDFLRKNGKVVSQHKTKSLDVAVAVPPFSAGGWVGRKVDDNKKPLVLISLR